MNATLSEGLMLQNWGALAMIVGGYLLGIYFQNRSIAHIDDMGKRFDDLGKRIDDARDTLRAEMRAMKAEIVDETRKAGEPEARVTAKAPTSGRTRINLCRRALT